MGLYQLSTRRKLSWQFIDNKLVAKRWLAVSFYVFHEKPILNAKDLFFVSYISYLTHILHDLFSLSWSLFFFTLHVLSLALFFFSQELFMVTPHGSICPMPLQIQSLPKWYLYKRTRRHVVCHLHSRLHIQFISTNVHRMYVDLCRPVTRYYYRYRAPCFNLYRCQPS